MFGEYPPLQRLKAAKLAGFSAVEWLFPYEIPLKSIGDELGRLDLSIVLINAALGDRAKGHIGIGAIPGCEQGFKDEFKRSLQYSRDLNIPNIHVMAGKVPQKSKLSSAAILDKFRNTFINNLRWAKEQIADSNITLLIEPLNCLDTPGYWLTDPNAAIEIIDELGEGFGLQLDFYHTRMNGLSVEKTLRECYSHIKHVQFSNVPGRHEPQHGEINCDYLFEVLKQLKYDAWIGCEYTPRHTTSEGLSWFDKHRESQSSRT